MDSQQDDKLETTLPIDVEPSEVQVTKMESVIESPKYEDPNATYNVVEEAPKASHNDNYNYNTSTEPRYNTGYDTTVDNSPMTMGDWLLTILVMTLLPCVGIPMYFVWAFSKNGNMNRKNYCRAYLIVMGVSMIIGIIISIVLGFAFISSIGNF